MLYFQSQISEMAVPIHMILDHHHISYYAGFSALGVFCTLFSTIFLHFPLSFAISSTLVVSMFILSRSLCTCFIHVCFCPPLGFLVILLYSVRAFLHGVSSGLLPQCMAIPSDLTFCCCIAPFFIFYNFCQSFV